MSDTSTVLFPAFAQYLTDGFLRMPKEGESEDVRLQNTSNLQIACARSTGETRARPMRCA